MQTISSQMAVRLSAQSTGQERTTPTERPPFVGEVSAELRG
jgi:hypothetical protein